MKKITILWLAVSAAILASAYFALRQTHRTTRATSTPAATRTLTPKKINGLWEVGYERSQLEELVQGAEVTTPVVEVKKATPKKVAKKVVAKATASTDIATNRPAAPHRLEAEPLQFQVLGNPKFSETMDRTGYQPVPQADDTLLEGWSANDDSTFLAIIRARQAQESQP